jgi:hypothetical protein
LFAGNSAKKGLVNGVYAYQTSFGLQADESSVVVKGPFFPQAWTRGTESVEQMWDARTNLLKSRTLRSSKEVLLHLM